VKILSMTASFGCLNHRTLTLHDGVNLLQLPNESGKSTWAAFLLAMFYGIDSSERAAKDRLPAKTKYLPWNGAPMEGTLVLEHQGREIVLERSSVGSRPMAAFRAWDKATGRTIEELTGSNCGTVLLGVERDVFRRTAFLSGQELQVTEDADLSRRLAALAAAGRQEDSFPAAMERLKVEKNRLRYHKTGRIPETQASLRQVEDTLRQIGELRRRRLAAEEPAEDPEARYRQEEAAWQKQKEQTREALLQMQQAEAALSARAAALPSAQRLEQMAAQLQQPPAQDVVLPAPLEGLSADALLSRAQQDTAACRYGAQLLWLLPAAGAAALGVHSLLTGGILSGLLLILGGLCFLAAACSRKKRRRICAAYGVRRPEEIVPCAVSCRDRLLAGQRSQWEHALLLEEIAAFSPEQTDPKQAVADALALCRQLEDLRQQVQAQQHQWAQLRTAEFAPGAALRQLQLTHARRMAQAESLRQQEALLGDPETLDAEKEKLEQTLADLLRKEAALELAQQTLRDAQREMEEGYAPRLTAEAGQCLRRLTDGRYTAMILQPNLRLLLQEGETGVTRPLAALSRGTQDQAWLALRLAMTRLLLPSGPLVLDDALLTFDGARTAAALRLLEQEGRQVLVFTCRSLTERN